VYFYPRPDARCTAEAGAFRDSYPKFAESARSRGDKLRLGRVTQRLATNAASLQDSATPTGSEAKVWSLAVDGIIQQGDYVVDKRGIVRYVSRRSSSDAPRQGGADGARLGCGEDGASKPYGPNGRRGPL